MRTCVWTLLMSLAIAVPAGAQETRGNISGTVKDATGVVPGATVTITSLDTRASQRLVTNGSGYFEAPLLQPGNYEITVAMTGFKTADAERPCSGSWPANEPHASPRGRSARRNGDRDRCHAVARHDVGLFRTELR